MSHVSSFPKAKAPPAAPARKREVPFKPAELDVLARAAWSREGSRPDRRAACRSEVAMQLRATRDLLVDELNAGNLPSP